MKAIDSVFSKATKVANSMYNDIKNINYAESVEKIARGMMAGLFLYATVGPSISAVAQENYSSNLGSKAIPSSSINYEAIPSNIQAISLEDAQKYVPHKEPIIKEAENAVQIPDSSYFSTPDSMYSYTETKSENKRSQEKQGNNLDAVVSFDGDEVLDQFSPPNYTIPLTGAGSLNYYGSGDTDNDGDLDFADHSTMLSNPSDRTDVNGDGVTNTADKTLLYNYLTDQIPYLQGHWGFLTSTEKTSWLQNMLAIDLTNQHPYIPGVWECGEYARQLMINFTGIENIANSGLDFSLYDTTDNARFNIPLYQVATKTSANVAHVVNSDLKGNPGNVFNQEEFTEPQTDQIVTPGNQSLNQFANIRRFCYYYNTTLQQYVYGDYPLINYTNINTNPTVSWQNPDLVVSKPVKWTYIHPGGANPADITIDPEDSTNPSNTGQPNPASWASTYYSDVSNRTGGNYDSTYWNYDIERAWKAISDSSSLIDTTYSSHDATNFPGLDPQTISVRDVTNPVVTENTTQTSISYSQYIQNGLIKPTVTDNCGYWDSTYVITTTQGSSGTCDFYEFMATATTIASDPTGNQTTSAKNVEVYLDDNQWTYFPANTSLPYWIPTTMENIGGPATAMNPAGPGVGVTWIINSTQNPDTTTCENVNYLDDVVYTATDSVCGSSIQGTQAVTKYKPMSLICTNLNTIQDTFYIGKTDPKDPPNVWEPEYVDTLKTWYSTGYSYTDELVHVSQTDSTWLRTFTGEEYVCNTTMSGPSHILIRDLEVGITEQKQEDLFTIYPNPTTGQAHIKMNNSNQKPGIIKVTDLAGRTLEEILVNKGIDEIIYDASRLNPGIYLINFGNETEKLLKVN